MRADSSRCGGHKYCDATLRFASWSANLEIARSDGVVRNCMCYTRENVVVVAPCYVVAEVLEEGAQPQNVDGELHAIVMDLGENM